MVTRRARNLWTGPLALFRALRLVTDHTDPETVSGWTLTTIKANGCLRTFSLVWKSSLINQNLLWRHFWIKLFTSFWVKIWQNMSSTVSHKCPQSRFWFTRELFDTTLKVLRQPLAWVVVKVQPEACSGSVCIHIEEFWCIHLKHNLVLHRAVLHWEHGIGTSLYITLI